MMLRYILITSKNVSIFSSVKIMKLKLVLQIHLHIISTISDGSTIYFDYTKKVELNLILASTEKFGQCISC